MKKFITAAAFLAASTALASAAELSAVWTDFNSSTIEGLSAATTGCTITSDGSVSTTASAHAVLTLRSALAATGNGAWSIAMTFDASSISQTETTTFFGLNVDTNRTNNGSPFMSLCGAYYAPTAGTLTFANYTTSNPTDSTFSLPTTGALTFIVSRNGTSSFTLGIYSGSTELTTLTSSAVLSYSGNIGTFDIGGHNSTVSGTTYVMKNAPEHSALTLTGMALYTDGVLTDDAAALSTYFSAAIPEPSAFGLLAGVGALALVAARRRRSRKAA